MRPRGGMGWAAVTLRLVSERPEPKTPRRRHFTPAEDDALREMCAAGLPLGAITRVLRRHRYSVQWRCEILGITPGTGRRGPRPSASNDGAHCTRCHILLARAPAGDGRVCGWCARETMTNIY